MTYEQEQEIGNALAVVQALRARYPRLGWLFTMQADFLIHAADLLRAGWTLPEARGLLEARKRQLVKAKREQLEEGRSFEQQDTRDFKVPPSLRKRATPTQPPQEPKQ